MHDEFRMRLNRLELRHPQTVRCKDLADGQAFVLGQTTKIEGIIHQ
jgi:hypothetical protein